MTEKYTTQLQCMSDLRTDYFYGPVMTELNYAVFELLFDNPMHFGLAVVLYL